MESDGTLIINIVFMSKLTAVYSTKSKEEFTNSCLLVFIEYVVCIQRINILSQRNNSGLFTRHGQPYTQPLPTTLLS